MKIEEMTAEQLKEALTRDPVVILPVGATEAHGPHLPLGTDSLQPEAIAEMVAKRVGALIAPPIRYGHHSSTRNMTGTLDITFDTLRALIRDVLLSLVRNGFRKIVILSGHAGQAHMAALRVASSEVVRQHSIRLMLLTDYDIIWDLSEELGIPPGDGHGGMVETSRIMAIAPHLVGRKRGSGKFIDQNFMIVPNPEICYPDGFAGRADLASGEIGNRINEFVVDRIVSLIQEKMEV